MSTACELCTGRHLTSLCSLGRQRIQECIDHPIIHIADPGPTPRNIVDLDQWRRRAERRRTFINRLQHRKVSVEKFG